jgi:hypothetical protein
MQVEALCGSLLALLADGEVPMRGRERLFSLIRLTPGDIHAVKSQYRLAEQGEMTLVPSRLLWERKKQKRYTNYRGGFILSPNLLKMWRDQSGNSLQIRQS